MQGMGKITGFLLLSGTFLFALGCSGPAFEVRDGLLIEHAQIVTCDSSGAIRTYLGNILTDGTVIRYAGAEMPRVSGSYRRIDATGRFVIPGLIDSHVHLNNIAGMDFRQRRGEPELVEGYFDRLPLNFLYYGYTGLVDVDAYAPQQLEAIRTKSLRPDIYTCGKKVAVMDDFEMEMGELSPAERLAQPFLFDPYNPNIRLPDSLDLPSHSASYLVSRIREEGHVCVKMLYEDASSGLPEVWESPSPEILVELVTEARAAGMVTLLHAPSLKGQQLALSAGVDIIAHGLWNWTNRPEEYLSTNLPRTHRDLLDSIAARQTGYQLTFRALLGERDILEGKGLDTTLLSKLYPEAYVNWLIMEGAPAGRARILARPEYLARVNPEFFVPVRARFESDSAFFQGLYHNLGSKLDTVASYLAGKNANLLFGTDTGAMNMYSHVPGYNGYREMQHWEEAGILLDKLFRAATYNNAKAFGMLGAVGTLEAGKRANILILEGNPLQALNAYDQISDVILGGKAYSRSDLSVRTRL